MEEYLGDSVYVKTDKFGGIVLYLNNGENPHNHIVLEGFVIKNLENFLKRVREDRN